MPNSKIPKDDLIDLDTAECMHGPLPVRNEGPFVPYEGGGALSYPIMHEM